MATKNSKTKQKVKKAENSAKTPSHPMARYPKGEVPPQLKAHTWEKGFCPNPAGRPKDVAAEFAREVLEGMTPQERQKAVRGFRNKLASGDGRAFVAISERGYGKQPQSLEHSGPGGAPFSAPVFTVNFKAPEVVETTSTTEVKEGQ